MKENENADINIIVDGIHNWKEQVNNNNNEKYIF